jgi:hypothetical protein
MKKMLLFALAALVVVPCINAQYHYSSVDYPGAARTRVFAINNLRQFVGAYYDSAGNSYAMFSNGGKLRTLDLSSLGSVNHTTAYSLNNAGSLVGQYTDASNNTHGYVYHDGDATPIDYPGATATAAYGINDFGDVIGVYVDTAGVLHSFRKHKNKFMTADIPGGETVPLSVNDWEEVVGEFIDVPNTTGHGYLQLRGGKYSLYDVPGAPPNSTFFISINNLNQILGEYFPSDSTYQNFILEDGNVVLFNLGGGLVPTYVSAQTINDREDVVGWFDDANGEHGFLAGHNRK